ncbi:hypothetical protein D3C84_1190130 [compost metagenome]
MELLLENLNVLMSIFIKIVMEIMMRALLEVFRIYATQILMYKTGYGKELMELVNITKIP